METIERNSSKTGAGIVKRGTLNYIDATRIARREGWNPREDFGEVKELAKSIRANGMLNAIRVKRLSPSTKDADFELVDGDRRLTAVELIIKEGSNVEDTFNVNEGIPAYIVDRSQDDLKSLIQMYEANGGKPFESMEEATYFKTLQDLGLTVAEMAKVVSKSSVHIYNSLALLDADDSVKEALASGDISKSQAKKIAHHTKGDKKAQQEIVAAAKTAGKGKGAKTKVIDKAVTKVRTAKAAAKGKTLKMRALSDADLSALGAKVAGLMMARMKEAGKPNDFDIRAWVALDDSRALAFTFGALEALKAAAGQTVQLEI